MTAKKHSATAYDLPTDEEIAKRDAHQKLADADIAQAIALNRKFVVKALLDERATASEERQVEIDELLEAYQP